MPRSSPPVNVLKDAPSLYLRQHGDNPVAWQVWGEQARARARDEQKLMMVSSGYAACHWCHVMARESFADPMIAAMLNRHYIAIKLDREEYPAIDGWLMEALQALGKPGGWPLTMFLTPDAVPFWGGTYFPPEIFARLLHDIIALYRQKPDDIARQSQRLGAALVQRPAPRGGQDDKKAALQATLALLDWQEGGVQGSMKFPCLPVGDYLALAGRAGETQAQAAADTLADALCLGGIFDHIGGGLFRYATDRRWRWPHFEKMLYDNGLALNWLAQCGHRGASPLWQSAAESIAAFLLAEMQLPQGGFAASLDADQADGEGAFYCWNAQAIEAVLGAADAKHWTDFFALHENPQGGDGLPYVCNPPASSVAMKKLARLRGRLAAARAKRSKPARDEKLLADANGLALEGLARAGLLLDRADFTDAAATHWPRLLARLWQNGRLHHCAYHHQQSPPLPAIADDYVFMIAAALALFEAQGKHDWLKWAFRLAETFDSAFWNAEQSGYLYAVRDTASPAPPRCHAIDGATPAANGRMVELSAKLAALADKESSRAHWLKRAASLITRFSPGDKMAGAGLRAARFWHDNLTTLAGDSAAMTPDEQHVLRQGWFPGLLLTHRCQPGQKAGSFILCRGTLCLAPAQGAAALAERLQEAADLLTL